MPQRRPSPPVLIGDHLRAARQRAGLTLTQTSERCGWSVAHISNLECDYRTNPRLDVLLGLAAMYKCSLDELVGRAAPQTCRDEAPKRS